MRPGDAAVSAALADAEPRTFWLETPERPSALPALDADTDADLAIVGGGYLGLWTALLAKERDPGRDVLLLEGRECGHAASGRNGGFCEASLTHGFGNGQARWPEDMPALLRLGRENLDAIERTVAERGIDCDFRRSGVVSVARQPHEIDWLTEQAEAMRAHDLPIELLDADEVRSRVDSPTFRAGLVEPEVALVEPARLAWGLRQACLDNGVRIHEHSPVTEVERVDAALNLAVGDRVVRADRAVLATNAYRPLLRRLRLMIVPVYDYALMTEPLGEDRLASIGWKGFEGVSDAANQFQYYRPTRDGRILFGGHDAVYHFGSAMAEKLEQREETFRTLAANFLTTFPQLEGVRFSHAWGGVIDTCTRFTAFYGTALSGRLAYALGFTGLGVGATRFAAQVMLDRLSGLETERTGLRMVRTRPVPFPPEPLRAAGIQLTSWSMARQDERRGRANLWLRAMDRMGFGFDS